MHLTCIGAAERPHMEVRAGAIEAFARRQGRHACRPWCSHGGLGILGPAIRGGALAGTKTR